VNPRKSAEVAFQTRSKTPPNKFSYQGGHDALMLLQGALKEHPTFVQTSSGQYMPPFCRQQKGYRGKSGMLPLTLADRLWVKTHLKPEEEKLQVSS
jgi:hypothetical protein